MNSTNNVFGNILVWVGLTALPLNLALKIEAFRTVSIVCVLLLFFTSLFTIGRNKTKLPKEISVWFKSILFAIFVGFLYQALSWKFSPNDILLVFIPLAILLGAYTSFNQDEESFHKTFVCFALISAICGIFLLIRTGGFVIFEIYREDVNKNQIGPFYSQLALISLAIALRNNKTNKMAAYILMVVYVVSISLCVILRARTSLVALLIASVILFYSRYRTKSVIYLTVIVAVIVIVGGESLQELLFASFVGDNRDLYDMNSLDSGRTERNILALDYINQNLFFGAASDKSLGVLVFSELYAIPHNFLLYRTVKYGMLGAIPFYIIYFLLLKTAYKLFKCGNIEMLGCLMIAILESFSEYESPFGPGTSYMLCYALLGRTLLISNTQQTITN